MKMLKYLKKNKNFHKDGSIKKKKKMSYISEFLLKMLQKNSSKHLFWSSAVSARKLSASDDFCSLSAEIYRVWIVKNNSFTWNQWITTFCIGVEKIGLMEVTVIWQIAFSNSRWLSLMQPSHVDSINPIMAANAATNDSFRCRRKTVLVNLLSLLLLYLSIYLSIYWLTVWSR